MTRDNYCSQCGVPVQDEQVICTQCYEALPAHFYCDACGTKCHKSKGEYGHRDQDIADDADVTLLCNECHEESQMEEVEL